MNDAKYIGLDVHQAAISVAVRDAAGKLVMEGLPETYVLARTKNTLSRTFCFQERSGSIGLYESRSWPSRRCPLLLCEVFDRRLHTSNPLA